MNVVIKTSISGDSNYLFLKQVVFIFRDIGLFTEIRPKETCNFFLLSLPMFHANTNPVCVTHDVPIPGIAVLNAFGFFVLTSNLLLFSQVASSQKQIKTFYFVERHCVNLTQSRSFYFWLISLPLTSFLQKLKFAP